MKTDKEILEAIEVKEKLESRGFRKISCKNCNGMGYFGIFFSQCLICHGKGYIWESPITK